MEASDTVFQAGWWGTELPGLRARVGTYGCYPYEPLPRPPEISFDGNFDWLRAEPIRKGSIYEADRNDIVMTFPKLAHFCAERSIVLPEPLIKFFSEPELAERIRSCTACFLDPATALVASPKGAGSIVRFLADQQYCVLWYLYLPVEGSDHCVLASPDNYAPDAAEESQDRSDPDSILYCAPGFESFMFRFWLENEYWYATHGFERSISKTAQQYLLSYGWSPESQASKTAGNRWWRRRLFGS